MHWEELSTSGGSSTITNAVFTSERYEKDETFFIIIGKIATFDCNEPQNLFIDSFV